MSYDPCGTQRLEGEDIIKRLAEYLGVDKNSLKKVLHDIALKQFVSDKLAVRDNERLD